MIEILSESETDTLAIRITGELTPDDYDILEPELDLRAELSEPFCLMIELADIDGVDPATLREELAFTRTFRDDIARVAVVTDDAPWKQLTDFVGQPLGELLGVDVERFDSRTEGWKWLRTT